MDPIISYEELSQRCPHPSCMASLIACGKFSLIPGNEFAMACYDFCHVWVEELYRQYGIRPSIMTRRQLMKLVVEEVVDEFDKYTMVQLQRKCMLQLRSHAHARRLLYFGIGVWIARHNS